MKPLLSLAASLALLAAAPAQKASVTVIHGIPGLPAPVDVFANGNKLFAFEFGETRGPLELAPATYNLEVKLRGNTVLSLRAAVKADTSYSIVAHLKEKSGIALSAFVNDTGKIDRGESRLIVRHLADAPAVDVIARRFFRSTTLFRNVMNGQEGKVDVRSGTYYVQLNAAGTRTRAFGPVRLSLRSNVVYAVHAIGDLADKNFRLSVQAIDLNPPVMLGAKIRGDACGGKIGISTRAPKFDEKFQVTLSGATANTVGFLHAGASDRRFLLFRLPLDLRILGAPGCKLYQNTTTILPIRTNARGAASRDITLPSRWARSFRELHFQYSFVARGKNRLGLQLTDYATVFKK